MEPCPQHLVVFNAVSCTRWRVRVCASCRSLRSEAALCRRSLPVSFVSPAAPVVVTSYYEDGPPPLPLPLSSLRTAMNASCGTSTLPSDFMRFLPSTCFLSSFFLRLMSPP